MPALDIFHNDAFSVQTLTDAVNKLKFVPGLIGSKGLFSETSVATTAISIEEKNGVLTLVSPTPRGGPGISITKEKRKLRWLGVPHFQIDDAVMAEEVQNVRAFGSESETETVMRVIAERGQYASQSFEATQEYSRVGAFKGIVKYADGSETNLFSDFEVSQDAEINFALGTDGSATGAIRQKCAAAIRQLAENLEGLPFSGVYAICGDAFYDALVSNQEVRTTFLNWQAAADLRSAYVSGGGQGWGLFEFGGISWENYRGAVGPQHFVDTDKCHIAPVAAGLFRTVYAPADYMETVNTLGQRMYTKQFPMPNDKGVVLESQMNALNYCVRPKALLKGKRA